ncbi:LON peptidase substrate-binding domain-containing protein [Aquiflexum lacus]|uniref:LON peptidase substrate-binding domain-containing protein n=1 Tax=Aquiflexum lacus TaxID=2483805 RepID=UPI001E401F1E|nr:LON peptidase substrate-binding domain-containing protein [Aquiflexum lacus]
METYIPIFPLKLVAFPGEEINLHIFEPRYKQLITDIVEKKTSFGIAVYLDKLMPIGTEVELKEVSKVYEDGRVDIKTVGKKVFEIITLENPMPQKLYAGGRVMFYENDQNIFQNIYSEYLFYLKELFRLMNYDIDLIPLQVNSFTYAHKIGLKLEEEYELLLMDKEEERVKYLIKHLLKVIPILRDIEAAKNKIKMNGHFKNFDPLEF